MMDPLNPESFSHNRRTINGLDYHYIDQTPSQSGNKPAIVLVHGFPDLWFGWRYQIRPLVEAGHRVIVPSTPGYCDTESPFPYEYYTFHRIATDIVTLLSTLGIPQAIYIGHDWGSVIVQRVALWYPEHVLAVAAICVPFVKPAESLVPLETLVKLFPNFAYQIWLMNPETERQLSDPKNIEKFLKGIFRIRGDPKVMWNADKDVLRKIGEPSLGRVWENQDVFQYYLRCFQRAGSMRGPLIYYKTRELNYKDELKLGSDPKIQCPAMFIGAERDPALPPILWKTQGWVPQLEMHTVKEGHWCLVADQGKEISPILQKWVRKVSQPTARL